MTIDEAIEKLLNKAEEQEYVSQIIVELHREESEREHKDACDACAADHRQLAEWLTELKDSRAVQNEQEIFIHELMDELEEAKRLLKAAVEDLNSVGRVLEDNDILCMKYIACKGCPFGGDNCNKWRYADEALKLIGGEIDG